MKKLALLGAGLGLLLYATPNEVSAGTSEITYNVQHGDTLSEIATKHEVSLPTLIENNPQIGIRILYSRINLSISITNHPQKVRN